MQRNPVAEIFACPLFSLQVRYCDFVIFEHQLHAYNFNIPIQSFNNRWDKVAKGKMPQGRGLLLVSLFTYLWEMIFSKQNIIQSERVTVEPGLANHNQHMPLHWNLKSLFLKNTFLHIFLLTAYLVFSLCQIFCTTFCPLREDRWMAKSRYIKIKDQIEPITNEQP